MKFVRAKMLLPIVVLLTAQAASPAPLTFDCDAPANVVSSVGNLAQASPTISGVIAAKRAREGRLVPTVGAQIDSPDGASTAGFVLTQTAPGAQQMDINLVIKRSDESLRRKVGTVSATEPIAFRLFVDQTGQATFYLNDQSWSYDFIRLIGGQEKVFCSTGQFAISELRFSD